MKILFSHFRMMEKMISVIIEKLKVFNSVVKLVSVFMMNNFLWFKIAANTFFHHNALSTLREME